MFKKRERFERTDVPGNSPYRNIIALVVLVVVAVLVFVVVSCSWKNAQRDSRLEMSNLSRSISSQKSVVPAEGYTLSGDTFTSVILFTVDNLEAKTPTLKAAQLLTINASKGAGYLVNIPLDTKIAWADGTVSTLADLYASSGSARCVTGVGMATNIQITHAIISTDEIWDQVANFKGKGITSIVGDSSDLVDKINTDMSSAELLDLAELVQSIGGAKSFNRIDAPIAAQEDVGGVIMQTIDQVQLGLTVGILVAPA